MATERFFSLDTQLLLCPSILVNFLYLHAGLPKKWYRKHVGEVQSINGGEYQGKKKKKGKHFVNTCPLVSRLK